MRFSTLGLLCLSAASLTGCWQKQGYTTVQVWNTSYDFATKDLRVSERGHPSPYVLIDSGEVKDPDFFVLEYEMREQVPLWPSGLPRISWITFRDTKPEDIFVRTIGKHELVCNKEAISVGLKYQCGIAFTERGARWTVRFGDRLVREPEKVLARAIDLLRQSQRSPRP